MADLEYVWDVLPHRRGGWNNGLSHAFHRKTNLAACNPMDFLFAGYPADQLAEAGFSLKIPEMPVCLKCAAALGFRFGARSTGFKRPGVCSDG